MDIYDEMIDSSRRIAASFPDPQFYESCASELAESERIFRQSPLVSRCRRLVVGGLSRNAGHGALHAEKVAIEAGALVLAEASRGGLGGRERKRAAALAHVTGLLHDMRRGDKDHARTGAAAADRLLQEDLNVAPAERQWVVGAIANHEAFVQPPIPVSALGKLLSDTLYDADKFRWGPDNFTVTLWEMLRSAHAPVVPVIRRFPEGMAGISRIRGTFRSATGKVFGPEFIELGLLIGDRILAFLRERFAREPE